MLIAAAADPNARAPGSGWAARRSLRSGATVPAFWSGCSAPPRDRRRGRQAHHSSLSGPGGPSGQARRVASSQAEKQELLAADSAKFFTEPHYNGFPAVLVRLPAIDTGELEELIIDAWRCQAPRDLAARL